MAVKKAKPGEQIPKPASANLRRQKDANRSGEMLGKNVAKHLKRTQSDTSRRRGS